MKPSRKEREQADVSFSGFAPLVGRGLEARAGHGPESNSVLATTAFWRGGKSSKIFLKSFVRKAEWW